MLWLVKLVMIAFPAALAQKLVLYQQFQRAILTTKLTRMLASTAALVKMLAL